MSRDDGEQITETIPIDGMDNARILLGRQDRHLKLLRDAFNIRVVMRGRVLMLEGESAAVRGAGQVVRDLCELVDREGRVSSRDVEFAIAEARQPDRLPRETRIDVFAPGRTIWPRTPGQAGYVRAIAENDLVFCIGPAGSGKTYIAVAMAVAALKRNDVRKIILTRPAVEAGEKLGFLPGDMEAKVNPYLRPLYDALHDMMVPDQVRKYMENDLLEVAPLAYMRGRTLDRAFIILDEGQNCTRGQMKMFLTRLGASSCSVVTGDISQSDLPSDEVSGMIEAMTLLREVKNIGFVRLTKKDIIRHRLVQDIVHAYDSYARSTASSGRETLQRVQPEHGMVPETQ